MGEDVCKVEDESGERKETGSRFMATSQYPRRTFWEIRPSYLEITTATLSRDTHTRTRRQMSQELPRKPPQEQQIGERVEGRVEVAEARPNKTERFKAPRGGSSEPTRAFHSRFLRPPPDWLRNAEQHVFPSCGPARLVSAKGFRLIKDPGPADTDL